LPMPMISPRGELFDPPTGAKNRDTAFVARR
jgi:hypothetical protein